MSLVSWKRDMPPLTKPMLQHCTAHLPICDCGTMVLFLSQSGENSSPISASRSPCTKNSSMQRDVHWWCTSHALDGCDTSAECSSRHSVRVLSKLQEDRDMRGEREREHLRGWVAILKGKKLALNLALNLAHFPILIHHVPDSEGQNGLKHPLFTVCLSGFSSQFISRFSSQFFFPFRIDAQDQVA